MSYLDKRATSKYLSKIQAFEEIRRQYKVERQAGNAIFLYNQIRSWIRRECADGA